jgi:hypothetical protein
MDLTVHQYEWCSAGNGTAVESMEWGLGLKELEMIFKKRNDAFTLLSAICECKGSLPPLEDVYFGDCGPTCMHCRKDLPHICKFCQLSQGIILCARSRLADFIFAKSVIQIAARKSRALMSAIYARGLELLIGDNCFRYLSALLLLTASALYAKRIGAMSVVSHAEIDVSSEILFAAINARRNKSAQDVENGSATVQNATTSTRGFV